jgi:activating signal cointegrator complex subunit 3
MINSTGMAYKNASLTIYRMLSMTDRPTELIHRDVETFIGRGPRSVSSPKFSAIFALAKELAVAESKHGLGSRQLEKQFGLDYLAHWDSSDVVLDGNEGTATTTSSSVSSSSSSSSSDNSSVSFDWLLAKVDRVGTQLGLPSDTLANEIVAMCQDPDVEACQTALFELCGDAQVEFIFEILESRQEIARISNRISKSPPIQLQPASAGEGSHLHDLHASSSQGDLGLIGSSSIESELNEMNERTDLSLNQRKKREKKLREQLEKEQEQNFSDPATDWLREVGFDGMYLEEERSLGLQNSSRVEDWKENLLPEGTLGEREKYSLPANTERKFGTGFEEVHMPAPKKTPPCGIPLVEISSLETWAQLAFAGTKKLNRIQSDVFKVAYHSLENMLVCAPTGAGKTNIAMLTFLSLVKTAISDGAVDKDAIKAIYIAPMKALAQEVVAKFSERLKPLGFAVREFTGDQQLTKQEIADSQIIVTTPEKWDVITRKGGDGSLGTLVKLIIIDEVHLLADERGAVIETIVARAHRYVESSQSMLRIIGLSATLPNYKDVSSFLRVNSQVGLFFFGPEYRPVGLDQTFIGVTEKQKLKQRESMNRFAYEKTIAALQRDKQVMVFVHARKETSRSAEAMRDLCAKYNTTGLLENVGHEKYSYWKKQVEKSKSAEVQQLFEHGLGVHHAGMLRPDRSLVEKLFELGLIKILFCTATLAWGVNLPAHTVIIKGTELYQPERGGFVDLSILDVLQIFGRAGRPQYDDSGHAILITPHKTLAKYLEMLAHASPIESALIKALPDHLNAEIVNGTINNINEAAIWLSYTFLFIRMCKNPLPYGMTFEDVFSDPRLQTKRTQLVTDAAITLDSAMMIRFDPRSGNLAPTDLGRIASHYYITHETIDSFNHMLNPEVGGADALHVLCASAEFDQLKMRPEELEEMDSLKKRTKVGIKAPVEDTAGKVNVLLQNFMQQSNIKSFTLQSDTNFIAQNASRIARALFEISLKRGWSSLALYYLTLCRSIDQRINTTQSPLRQFGSELSYHVLTAIEKSGATLEQMLDMESRELDQLSRSKGSGAKIASLLRRIPYLEADVQLKPITRSMLRVVIELRCSFTWVERWHGGAEAFWVWIEDGENEYIYHSEYILVQKSRRDDAHVLDFAIPIREPLPPQYYLRIASDTWIGSDALIPVSFQHLLLPDNQPVYTSLLDLHPLPLSALQQPRFEKIYAGVSHFNPIQTQVFPLLYRSTMNALVGAPTGSGKTIMSELALLCLLRDRPGKKCVYIAPLKALARERVRDWKRKFGQGLGLTVVELSGDVSPDLASLRRADVIVTTPEKWDGVTRGWTKRNYVQQVELMIIDEIHLLGVDRGPVLEVIVSRMRYISAQTTNPIRFVGLSTALANARDLGDWLGIGALGVYNFRPAVRPIPMTIHIQGFSGKHYCPRMSTMNKPAYACIKEHSPHKPVLIFVSSRRQTRLTALDLISSCASDEDPQQFLHFPEDEAAAVASSCTDKALQDTLPFGVVIHHAGLCNHDRETVETLFAQGRVQVLVCTSTLAWGVNFPAHLVIVKGTEYFDGKIGKYVDYPVTDVLQMMGRAGRPQFDDQGVASIFVHDTKKTFYRKFLYEPFPVESSLHEQLHNHLNAEIATEAVLNMVDAIDWVSYTYYFQRLLMNPTYYHLDSTEPASVETHLTSLLSNTLATLQDSKCVQVDSETGSFAATFLGKVAAKYYLDHKTVYLFHDKLEQFPTSADPLVDAVALLSQAHEFSELPVRHNEEILNEELADQLPWHIGVMPLDSPHTKTFLLIQAHIYRQNLPISDYINDTKSVLDQVPRVLSALLDIAANQGNTGVALSAIEISQRVVQGLSPEKSELMQLAMDGSTLAHFERESRLKTIAAVRSHQQLAEKVFLQKQPKGDLNEFQRSLQCMPVFHSLSTDITFGDEPTGDDQDGNTKLVLTVRMKASGLRRGSIYCPRYTRGKAMTVQVLVSDSSGRLLAMQTLEQQGSATELLISFTLRVGRGIDKLILNVVPDCFLNLNKTLTIDVMRV